MAGRLIHLYDLAEETALLSQMQEVSLDDSDRGLAPDPLVGSPRWWDELREGQRATVRVEGVIASTFWTGMADYPEFELRSGDGSASSWHREGDIRRYVWGPSGPV